MGLTVYAASRKQSMDCARLRGTSTYAWTKTIRYKRLAGDWAIWIREDGAFIAVHGDGMAAAATDDKALDDIAVLFGEFMGLKDLGEIREYLAISMRYGVSKNVFLLSQERYILNGIWGEHSF